MYQLTTNQFPNNNMSSFIFDTSINQDADIKICLYDTDIKIKMELLHDGRVFYWYRDSVFDDWKNGMIYNNQDEYNENIWNYKGEINAKTRLPCGKGFEYNQKTQKTESVYYLYDGAKYTGDCVDMAMNGYGKYTCDAFTYEGTFSDGDFCGFGKSTYIDGATMEGHYRKDMMNGEGTFICSEYTYLGEFIDDLSEGLGKITWKNGNSYEGKFVDDNIDLYYDKGVFTFADGSKYIGCLNKIWDILIDSEQHKV